MVIWPEVMSYASRNIGNVDTKVVGLKKVVGLSAKLPSGERKRPTKGRSQMRIVVQGETRRVPIQRQPLNQPFWHFRCNSSMWMSMQWHNIEPVQNKTRRFKVSSLFWSGVQGNCSMFMSIFTHKFVPLIDIDFKCCKNVPLQCRHKHGSCWSTYSTQVGSGIIGYIYGHKVAPIIDIDFKFGYAAVLCVAAKLFIANHCDSNTKIKLIIRKTATKSWH